MCGRFTLRTPPNLLVEQFMLPGLADVSPRYNVAPSQTIVAMRRLPDAAGRQMALLKWGLVPGWADDPAIGNRLINARSETAAEKPSFRHAFKKRRCLILADGFYEWKAAGKRKQPHYITLAGGRPFAMAGLWESWRREERHIESCTILTTTANDLMKSLHDRMPVILPEEVYDLWLDPQLQQSEPLLPLMRPYPAEEMQYAPVSMAVNSPQCDDERCLESPAEESPPAEDSGPMLF